MLLKRQKYRTEEYIAELVSSQENMLYVVKYDFHITANIQSTVHAAL